MKNKKEFYDYVIENVRRYLPPSFGDAQIFIEVKEKENGRKIPVLLIMRQEEASLPCIPLEEAYCDYVKGDDLDICVRKIADLRMRYDHLEYLADLSYASDYEKVKGRLMIRLCDPELNQGWLENKIYSMHGDFAAVYYVELCEEREKTFSMPVTKQLMEKWKVTLKQLHEDALLSEREKQVFLFGLDDYIGSLMTGNGIIRNLLDGETEWHPETAGMPTLCLTNSSGTNGASMILQKDIMKRIGEILGSDFYVLPSSIHETLLVPSGGMEVSELSQLVKDVNETQVELCDWLSDKVQYYDRAKGVLENAERRNQKISFLIMNGEFYTEKGIEAA